jgi:hypothetical protein
MIAPDPMHPRQFLIPYMAKELKIFFVCEQKSQTRAVSHGLNFVRLAQSAPPELEVTLKP